MSKVEELAHKLDFEYADNGAGYNSEWTRGLQEAAALLRQQAEANRLALEALEKNWAVVMNHSTGDQHMLNAAIAKLREALK